MEKRYKPIIKDYTFIYIAKWEIEGFNHYGFLADKRLFNYKTNRFSKKVMRNYSIGYNLDGKFYTLKKMQKLTSLIQLSSSNNFNKKSVKQLYNYLVAA